MKRERRRVESEMDKQLKLDFFSSFRVAKKKKPRLKFSKG